MNYFGSYKRLLANSKSAMVGAIEIYNKPRFDYRDEVFVILLLNAWELMLKALLSKRRVSIFYKKSVGQPYRTLTWQDALNRAVHRRAWPPGIPFRAIEANLRQLTTYRDAAVHFYNQPSFGIIVYSLAQTSITNYRDLLREEFGQELADEITWQLLPLGTEPPIDPISYLRGGREINHSSGAIDEFLRNLADAAASLEEDGVDTSRLMTIYGVKLQSMKRIEAADVVVGVKAGGEDPSDDPIFIERKVDPRRSHPYFMKDVLERVSRPDGRPFNSYDFQAVTHTHRMRGDDRWCHEDAERNYVRWSADLVTFINSLTSSQIDEARAELAAFRRSQRRTA